MQIESCESCKKIRTICFGIALLAPGFLTCKLFVLLTCFVFLFIYFWLFGPLICSSLLESDKRRKVCGFFGFGEVCFEYGVESVGKLLLLCGLIPKQNVIWSHSKMTHLKGRES